jgi:hypothetical protein
LSHIYCLLYLTATSSMVSYSHLLPSVPLAWLHYASLTTQPLSLTTCSQQHSTR